MNQINFLPESFKRLRRRQQRRPIEFMAIGATALALIALWLTMAGPDRALAREAAELDQQLDRIAQQQAEQDRLKFERGVLTHKLMIARETYQPITATQVLSRLSALTPPPVRLVSFELDTERPEPEPAEKPEKPNKRVVASAGDKPATKPREPHRMKVSIVALSPTDEEVVALIRALEADPVFSGVTLRNSRMSKTKTHFAREFQLDLEIDLDRRFVPTSGRGVPGHAD